jgi:ABC-2 type transport system ATP-binding protein
VRWRLDQLPPKLQSSDVADVPAVETELLTRRFGDVVAVDEVSVRIERSTVFGLLGSNGAGKSTLIKMLTTLLPPSSGRARVAGHDVEREPREVRRRIGYVPQLVSADGTLTGRENLLLFARLYGVPRGERAARIDQALAFMDLTGVAGRLVRTYSGGMIRRLEIAQALLHRPGVLFLDEPTVGLDPVARHAVWERLRQLRTEFGTTILLTTHDMEEADELCDALAILHRGKVRVSGTPEALKSALGPEASLEQVFIHHVGEALDTGGNYRDVGRARRTAKRLQ